MLCWARVGVQFSLLVVVVTSWLAGRPPTTKRSDASSRRTTSQPHTDLAHCVAPGCHDGREEQRPCDVRDPHRTQHPRVCHRQPVAHVQIRQRCGARRALPAHNRTAAAERACVHGSAPVRRAGRPAGRCAQSDSACTHTSDGQCGPPACCTYETAARPLTTRHVEAIGMATASVE